MQNYNVRSVVINGKENNVFEQQLGIESQANGSSSASDPSF